MALITTCRHDVMLGVAMQLRPYQQEALDAIDRSRSNKCMIQMPTGAGKTIVFLNTALNHWKKVLVIVPTIDLRDQVLDRASKFYPDKSAMAYHSRDWRNTCWLTTCTSQSLR